MQIAPLSVVYAVFSSRVRSFFEPASSANAVAAEKTHAAMRNGRIALFMVSSPHGSFSLTPLSFLSAPSPALASADIALRYIERPARFPATDQRYIFYHRDRRLFPPGG